MCFVVRITNPFFSDVDDLVLTVPSNDLDELLKTFNSYNPHIQYIIETETEKSVSFLDTLPIRSNYNKILIDWYVKPSASV